MTTTPTDAEMISAAIDSKLIDVHTSLPGVVQSYNKLLQTATIVLQVKRVLPKAGGGFVTEELPVLENVPVVFPRTKKFMITFPIEEGDEGEVAFQEMSIDQWRSKGSVTSPGDIGRHTLTAGVFRPGLSSNLSVITPPDTDIGSDMILGEIAGVQVRVKAGGPIEVVSSGSSTAADFVAMAAKTEAGLQTIVDAITGAAVLANDGGATFKANILLALSDPVDSVASSNLKAD